MGAKFYRANYNSKKIRKRFSQTRTWFRTLKWVCYHAHPTLIAGHPFKGGWIASTGFLANPEMARFQISSPFLFSPPNPQKTPSNNLQISGESPSFASFFSAYFGLDSIQIKDQKCGKVLANMKRCFYNHPSNPVDACAFHIDGFKRMTCANN